MNVGEWLVSAEAARWRRSLDPLAWVVLEGVLLAARDDAMVEVGARRLAAELGLDRDAVARALARQCAVEVLVRLSQRRDGGRFGAGRFELRLPCLPPTDTVKADTVQPDTVQPDTVQPDTVKAATVGSGRRRGIGASVAVTEQGSLFDAAPALHPATRPAPTVAPPSAPAPLAAPTPTHPRAPLTSTPFPVPPQPAHELASVMPPGRSPRRVKGEGGPC